MTARVCLLSPIAEEFHTQPPAPAAVKGFWSGLIGFLGKKAKATTVAPADPNLSALADFEAAGFVTFAKIGDVIILMNIAGNHRQVALLENDTPWDLADWGEGSSFRSRFLAECYFMVTKDDFQIDADETMVLNALFNCLNPSVEEIAEAKGMVYWTLVESTMEDRILTSEEMDTMDKIIAALELKREELQGLHEKAIETKFEELLELATEEPITEEQIAMIERMATNVGLSPEFIQKHAAKVRAFITPAS